jgi:hypothetical protein
MKTKQIKMDPELARAMKNRLECDGMLGWCDRRRPSRQCERSQNCSGRIGRLNGCDDSHRTAADLALQDIHQENPGTRKMNES